MKYTLEEKIFMCKEYMFLGSQTLVQRAWRTKYVCSTAPSCSTIMMTARKFKKTGSVIKMNRKTRSISQKRKNAKIILERIISENPSMSLRKASQEANVSYCVARIILRDDLDLKPYKAK